MTRRISFHCETCGGTLEAVGLADVWMVERTHLATCPSLAGPPKLRAGKQAPPVDVDTGSRL